ncbi:MAG: CoA-binding protein [Bacteroidia bacterium]
MSKERITLILGASESKIRYSNKAAERLLFGNEKIIQVGKRMGEAYGEPILTEWPIDANVHTITLYLNPGHQKPWYKQIIDSKPERVIFNPGTENPELVALLNENAIPFEYACTLVLLAVGQY